MFFVVLEDGTIAVEGRDFINWDDIPYDSSIKSVGLYLETGWLGKTLLFQPLPQGCTRWYCGRLGSAAIDKRGRQIGYVLAGIKDSTCYRIEVSHRGVGPMELIPLQYVKYPEGVWRDGC